MRKQSNREAQESLRFETIGQITGGLVHEYNNLLGIILGSLDMLRETLPKDDGVQRHYHAALDASLRATEHTRSLLTSTRLNPLKGGERDLNEMVSEIIPLVHASLGGSTMLHTPLFDEALFVQIEASVLYTAVLNLAFDARAAMQHAHEKILTLTTRREDIAGDDHTALAAGSYAVLEIGDTGSRLPQGSEQDTAETPARGATTGEQIGRGFDIAQRDTELCGGILTVRHSPGQGTLVSLYLPIAKESSSHPVERASTATSARKHALVVDDEEGLRTLASEWLESIGFDVETAASADEALSLLAARQFDFLFSDILMPGSMDGIALARLAKAGHPALQILLTSGYAPALTETESIPWAVLKKPYRKVDLVAGIATTARAAIAPA